MYNALLLFWNILIVVARYSCDCFGNKKLWVHDSKTSLQWVPTMLNFSQVPLTVLGYYCSQEPESTCTTLMGQFNFYIWPLKTLTGLKLLQSQLLSYIEMTNLGVSM